MQVSVPVWMWCVIGWIAFMVALDVFIIITTFREKRPIWPFEPIPDPNAGDAHSPSSSTSIPAPPQASMASSNAYQPAASIEDELPLSPFAMQHGAELTEMGYEYLGVFRHAKGGIYQIRHDAMVSPDRLILAFVEVGTLAKIPIANVTMVSLGTRPVAHAGNRRSDLICDNTSIVSENAFEPDPTGRGQSMVFPNATCRELQTLHLRRFATLTPRPFGDAPLDEYHRYRLQIAEAAEREGSLYRVEGEPNFQRPHAWGAIGIFVAMKKFMWGRRVWPHRFRVKRLPQVDQVAQQHAR